MLMDKGLIIVKMAILHKLIYKYLSQFQQVLFSFIETDKIDAQIHLEIQPRKPTRIF